MFEDYQKSLKTQDGVSILLRPLKNSDERLLRDFLARIPDQERWFLRDDTTYTSATSEWLRHLDYYKVVPLVAVNTENGSIIANIQLHRPMAECLRHIAHVRVMVDPFYRRQAIGPSLLLTAVKLSTDMGIEKLAAEFVVGVQEPAIRAALKLDFFEQARLKDYVKGRHGDYHDLIIMVKTLQTNFDNF
ncbi:MAG: GNAT family N-acetyltransferase [Desulfomonilaceae bacterium]